MPHSGFGDFHRMKLRQIFDKKTIEKEVAPDRVRALYHLGDLDDYYFKKCEWYFVTAAEKTASVILLYKTWGTTLLPLGSPSGLRFFLENHSDLLPDEFYAVWMPEHDVVMAETLELPGKRPMLRMAVTSDTFLPCRSGHEVVNLDMSHLSDVRELLRSYPNNFLEEYQLNTGYYRGIFEDESLIAMAGVHTINRNTGVVAIGNVVTDEAHRGRGLAREVTSRLVADLLTNHRLIGLNVSSDNEPAIRVYRKLGFDIRLEFFEGDCMKMKQANDV